MPYETQRDNIISYLLKVLNSTNCFSVVEPAYRFKGEHAQGLNVQRKRHIYLEERADCAFDREPRKYLIIANSDIMSGKDFGEKLAAASLSNVYTMHVIYKYLQSKKQTETVGPLWRRFILDEARSPGASFHKVAGYRKDSFKHLGKLQESLRRLTRFERELVMPLLSGNMLLYQPKSPRLKECLRRFRIETVQRHQNEHYEGYDKKGIYIVNPPGMYDAREEMLPVPVEQSSFFTVIPSQEAGRRVIQQLDGRIEGYNLGRGLNGQNLLLSDFLALPNIKCEEPHGLALRQELALLERKISSTPLSERGPLIDHAEHIAIQLEGNKVPEDHALSLLYADLTERLQEPEIIKVESKTIEHTPLIVKIKYASRSKKGVWWTTTASGNLHELDSFDTDCNCWGNRRWDHCWHQKDIRESIRDIIEGKQ